MTMKSLHPVKSLSAALGAGGLIALAVMTAHSGLAPSGAGSFEAKGGGSGPTYSAPHVPGMQMGQTAGEEPAPVTTTTVPLGHPATS